MWKIHYKKNHSDLSFVRCCLFSGAVSAEEVRLWAEEVIRTMPIDDIPEYIFDLVDCHSNGEIIKVVPFGSGGITKREDLAISGIAFMRKLRDDEHLTTNLGVSRGKALLALKRNPQLLKKFRRFFPFVDIDPVVKLD